MKFKRADADDAWHFLNISDPSPESCKCCSSGAACDKWVNWITRIVDVQKENPENLLRDFSSATWKNLSSEKQFSFQRVSKTASNVNLSLSIVNESQRKQQNWLHEFPILKHLWNFCSHLIFAIDDWTCFINFSSLCEGFPFSTLKGLLLKTKCHLGQAVLL